jgi:hypothetical protein
MYMGLQRSRNITIHPQLKPASQTQTEVTTLATYSRIMTFEARSELCWVLHTVLALPWLRRLLAAEVGLSAGQSMWDLWSTKWHLDRAFSEFFGFPLSIWFRRGSAYSYIIWRMNNKRVCGCSSETQSNPTDTNNKTILSHLQRSPGK